MDGGRAAACPVKPTASVNPAIVCAYRVAIASPCVGRSGSPRFRVKNIKSVRKDSPLSVGNDRFGRRVSRETVAYMWSRRLNVDDGPSLVMDGGVAASSQVTLLL